MQPAFGLAAGIITIYMSCSPWIILSDTVTSSNHAIIELALLENGIHTHVVCIISSIEYNLEASEGICIVLAWVRHYYWSDTWYATQVATGVICDM